MFVSLFALLWSGYCIDTHANLNDTATLTKQYAKRTYGVEGCDPNQLRTGTERLQCLQYDLGNEETGTRWQEGRFVNGHMSQSISSKGYTYQSCQCPLQYFDEEIFCKSICGKRILMVGDSTMERFALSLKHLVKINAYKGKLCPTLNGCAHMPGHKMPLHPLGSGCNPVTRTQILDQLICTQTKSCKGYQNQLVQYIRHDYLTGHHGRRWDHSSVCDVWLDSLATSDIVILTFGAHLPQVLDYPFGMANPGNQTFEGIISEIGKKTAQAIRNRAKENAKVIFFTGSRGTLNHTHSCYTPPFVNRYDPDIPVDSVENGYHWRDIQRSNQVFIQSMKTILGKQLLVMDTNELFLKMPGCRNDAIHFRVDTPASPPTIMWQILMNMLLEI